jgi:hypothetical protein
MLKYKPRRRMKILTIYCRILKRELSRNVFECESTQQFEKVLDHLDRIAEFCDQEVRMLPSNVRSKMKMLCYYHIFINGWINCSSSPKHSSLTFGGHRTFFPFRAERTNCWHWKRLWRNSLRKRVA